ncbi:MAG TPA: response regulator transcription factor [Thermodesulfovibrionales bacterium]|nr:response regulator transcription factor [Thermodesulfovibrionales bacterium]
MKVLLVEDDGDISAFVKLGLEEESFTVDIASNGVDGLAMATSTNYGLIILDIMLPGINGKDLCKKIREEGIRTPVLMLTGLGAIADKVESLEIGADDYVTKPFSLVEMIARVKALIRRSSDLASELSLADLKMDLLSRRAFRGDRELTLTAKEFALLEFLLRHKDKVLSRTQIIEKVWGYTLEQGTNVVDVHIKSLRDKVDKGFQPKLIHTVRGTGYVLKIKDT